MNLMKSKLYIAFGLVLLGTQFAYSDDITSGSIGLIKPTTGQIDKTGRSWGDKLNFNFDVIASTIEKSINIAQNIFSTQIANGQVYGEDIARGAVAASQTEILLLAL